MSYVCFMIESPIPIWYGASPYVALTCSLSRISSCFMHVVTLQHTAIYILHESAYSYSLLHHSISSRLHMTEINLLHNLISPKRPIWQQTFIHILSNVGWICVLLCTKWAYTHGMWPPLLALLPIKSMSYIYIYIYGL